MATHMASPSSPSLQLLPLWSHLSSTNGCGGRPGLRCPVPCPKPSGAQCHAPEAASLCACCRSSSHAEAMTTTVLSQAPLEPVRPTHFAGGHKQHLAITVERLKAVLFIPRTTQLHLHPSEASLLGALESDVAIARAHVLLQHLPEAPTYRLLRALPGSLLAAPFSDVFARLLALGRALCGLSVGQVLECAVSMPDLLTADPEELGGRVARVVEAAAVRLRAREPAALVRAMLLHRTDLLEHPPAEIEVRMQALERHKHLSHTASRMSAGGYATESAARRLASWLCADAALASRLESLQESSRDDEEGTDGLAGAGGWGHLDSLSDLWLYQQGGAQAPHQGGQPEGLGVCGA